MSSQFEHLTHAPRAGVAKTAFAATNRSVWVGPPHELSHRVLLALAGDVVCCIGGMMLAFRLAGESGTLQRLVTGHEKALLAWLAAMTISMYYFDGYSVARMAQRLNMMMSALKAGLVGAVLFTSAIYTLSSDQLSKSAGLGIITYTVVAMVIWRWILSSAVRRYIPRRRVAIVGMGWAGSCIATELLARPDEYEIVGVYDDNLEKLTDAIQANVATGPVSQAAERLSGRAADLCVMAITNTMSAEVHRTMQRIYRENIPIAPMAELFEFLTGRVPLDHLGQNWFVNMGYSNHDPILVLGKRLADIAAASVAIALTSPIWVLVAAAIKLSSPGPVFYRQQRVGLNGRIFSIWKFRSMRDDAEGSCGAVWAKRADPRITPVGRFIRKTRLDELPQFINILKGEMSLVGPRPERPEFVSRFESEIPFYGMRLALPPGLTGWAQVRHKYDESLDDVSRKLQYDLFYIKHWSLFLDLRILIKTIATVLTGNGAH